MPAKPRRKAMKTNARSASSVAVSIAMLQQNAEQTNHQFDVLGEKFDRILSRVEELALHTTSLNTRHDTQIQVLQKQLASTETALNQAREDITAMTSRLTELVGKELSEAISEMSTAIDELSDKMEKRNEQLDVRVQKLERWRMILIGGGAVIGYLLSNAADRVVHTIFSSVTK